jgi:hypothetical protein
VTRARRRAEWVGRHRGGVPEFEPAQRSSSASVHLHIDELVLHGFPAGARHPIADAVQQELARLFGEYGVPSHMTGAGAARIDAGSFRAVAGAMPAVIGTQIAGAVYGGATR